MSGLYPPVGGLGAAGARLAVGVLRGNGADDDDFCR